MKWWPADGARPTPPRTKVPVRCVISGGNAASSDKVLEGRMCIIRRNARTGDCRSVPRLAGEGDTGTRRDIGPA
ncbi:hypothetical protein FHX34_1021237 [Actinoplanes teichomyceticus]|uniref:Uncharacterized protein n=1 Tax=Actinoplanes teichomyceticus TaxID=1867 RepID=A0A561WLC9_ACTTI|nr:hypothetical protein FHX34_1021237 [Actinoplanes teichomyceticus]GIF14660.1 hypothetical protein Ate01nite_46920 [Actinoplanes teichomyceticus]